MMGVEDLLHLVVVRDVPEPAIEAFENDDVNVLRLYILKETLQPLTSTECLACADALIGIDADHPVPLPFGVLLEIIFLL